MDLTGLASNKQASKRQARAKWAKLQLRRGAADVAKVLVDYTYWFNEQSHEVQARNTAVEAENGRCKCRSSDFKICNLGPKSAIFSEICLGA